MFEVDLIKLSYLPNKTLKILRPLCLKTSNLKSFLNLPEVRSKISYISNKEVAGDLLKLRNANLKIISFFDELYPSKLKEIEDFPLVFYFAGKEQYLLAPKIAIVGSRNPSLSNIKLVEELSKYISSHNIVVVSGFARGIDTVVHHNASRNIAVFGAGLDEIYPKENSLIYQEMMIEQACISEYPLGTKPRKFNFPKRNRIISALSDIVVIVEAKLNSGSMITANFALEYGKEIFAVPGHPYDIRVLGCNKLIKDGAHILTDFINIIEVFTRSMQEKVRVNKYIGSKEDILSKDITIDEKEVINLLSEQGSFIDEIQSKLEIDISFLQQMLARLEMKGLVYQDGFGKICRKF